jgi:hypothetical protein
MAIGKFKMLEISNLLSLPPLKNGLTSGLSDKLTLKSLQEHVGSGDSINSFSRSKKRVY